MDAGGQLNPYIYDLLARHRRRCQPKKVFSKRKACTECVRSKQKCCYTQPTCPRCAKRGFRCEYVTPNAAIGENNTVDVNPDSEMTEDTSMPHANTSIAPAILPQNVTSAHAMWDYRLDTPPHSWSTDLLTFAPQNDSIETIIAETTAENTIPLNTNSSLYEGETLPVDSTTWSGISLPSIPSVTLADSNIDSMLNDVPEQGISLAKLVHVLQEYPKLFLRDGYRSPIIHRELYHHGSTRDITEMQRSSIAISCAVGFDLKESCTFTQRVINSERTRLVETFHALSCVDEMDALHAMLLYEITELRECLNDGERWRSGSRPKGLHRLLLLKMTKRFCESHPEAYNDSTQISYREDISFGSASKAWNTWYVAEAARRLIFLVNITNFLAGIDPGSGRQSPYYEPLSDDLILNMSLPSSTALWEARCEADWLDSLRQLEMGMQSGGKDTIRRLLDTHTKDDIRMIYSNDYGLGNSNDFRGFVILAALEQFS
ncbi:hypothetical protein M501DRAFT_1035360 [Patellaria atrata CBS 101060]|uniref:Zn(2)-C6 fungal-type domain-containing protein n=1 Tax=Patellaria atrata CBS 101060 TaxID=1346257 RepID=A0A9P4VKE3_9PEZI|nr:hypothetical protein M501DRAFT_1035360 [Patellaria atrata CBS 101060]